MSLGVLWRTQKLLWNEGQSKMILSDTKYNAGFQTYWQQSEIRTLPVTWCQNLRTIALILSQRNTKALEGGLVNFIWANYYKSWACAEMSAMYPKTFLNSSSGLSTFFSHANLILTTQSNSSPISLESCSTRGIQWDFSLSVVQSHSDTSSTKTMLCICHCVAHLYTEWASVE